MTVNQSRIIDLRFSVATSIGGVEVIDNESGRPLAVFDARPEAEDEAAGLNQAAANGPRALARALGAIEDDE